MRLFPGVRIVDLPAPLDDGLPVMDVPVFVGFAERGPLDRPVALEDPAHYTAVFGGSLDLVLAAEADESGSSQPPMMRAHLPAAVAAGRLRALPTRRNAAGHAPGRSSELAARRR